MKKLALALVLIIYTHQGFSYNGSSTVTVPTNLQAALFSTNYSKVTFDQQQKVLISSFGAGLIVYDGVNFTNYTPSNSAISSSLVTETAVNSLNHYYAVGDSGLNHFDGNTWTNYSTTNSGIVSDRLKSVSCHGSDVLVGGFQGFSIFNSGTFTNYTSQNSLLSNDTINGFAYDSNNDLWLATQNGLNKLSNGVISNYTMSNSSIPGNRIASLFAHGNELWMSIADVGIVRFSNNNFVTLDQLLNAPANLKFASSICNGPNGGIMFMEPNKKIFCEYAQQRLKTYYFQNFLFFNPLCPIAYDSISNQVWVSSVSKRFGLIDFDTYVPSLYSNSTIFYGSTITYENSQYLDANQVRAAILNLGDMFTDGSRARYECPKNSGKQAVYANACWIGGLSPQGNLHLAAQTYRQSGSDFWPGPLDTVTGSTDSAKCVQYNRIWKINKQDIADFVSNYALGNVQNGSFIPAEAILSWPVGDTGNYSRRMAPFVDVNQDGIYNPIASGDYPLIKGDQMLFWIFNDNLAWHTESEASPLKVEIHASAYAYENPNLGSTDSILNYTTLFHYDVFNRSNQSYDSCHIANWIDFDLGNPIDDKSGTKVSRNLVYCYNGDSLDEGNSGSEYGLNPPIISSVILSGPPAYSNDGIDNNHNGTIDEPNEKVGMSSSINYENNFTLYGNPSFDYHYGNYLNGKWKDSSPITVGQNGYGGTTPTHFIYPDFPDSLGGWSQATSVDGRMVQACGPFHLGAGQSVSYDYAFIFSNHPNLPYNSSAYYSSILSDADSVINWFNRGSFPTSNSSNFTALKDNSSSFLELYPNPGKGKITLILSSGLALRTLSVYDLHGKRLNDYRFGQNNGEVTVNLDYPAGLYFVYAADEQGHFHRGKLIVR